MEEKDLELLTELKDKALKSRSYNLSAELDNACTILKKQLKDKEDNEFTDIMARYDATHIIEQVNNEQVRLYRLKYNESIHYGNGKTYYWLLTEK